MTKKSNHNVVDGAFQTVEDFLQAIRRDIDERADHDHEGHWEKFLKELASSGAKPLANLLIAYAEVKRWSNKNPGV